MMVRIKVLNICKISIYQILNFMLKIKTTKAPCIFENQFTDFQPQYSTRFSKNSLIFCFITRTKTLEQTIRPKTKISGPPNLF